MRWAYRILIVSFTLLVAQNSIIAQQNEPPSISKGTIDLSSWDFSEPIPLQGEWQFWWMELLHADELSQKTPADYHCMPCLWNDGASEKLSLSPKGYATYRLNIQLPYKGYPIGLFIPDVYSAIAVYANGKQVYAVGTVGKDEETSKPNWGVQTVEYTSNTDAVELIIHISNFTHSRGGMAEPILIAKPDIIQELYKSQLFQSLFLTGCLFMGGLFFLGLFLFGRHEKPILYFSLFCFTYGYRLIGTDDYFLQSIFSGIPFWLTYILEYFSLFASVGLFAEYTYVLYPKESSKTLCRIIVGFSILLFIVTLVAPIYYSSLLVRSYLAVLLVLFIYAFYVYLRATMAKRTGAIYSLISTGIVLFTFGNIVLSYFQIIEDHPFFYFFGYIAFFFFQSLVLSYRFTHSLNKAKEEAETAAIAKTEFLSTMSHEIRTPLNAVIGMSHLLSEDPRPDQKEHLSTLTFSAKNLLYLINDILDYNKIDSGKLEFDEAELYIRELIENLAQTHKPAALNKNIELKTYIDPKVPEIILADHTRLSQILNNLISNAVKFTRKGEVNISVKLVTKSKNKAALKFTIEDTGIGIPQNKMDFIFQAFSQASSNTTREFGGTGLGLSISKKLLELQGVSIHVHSIEKKGSRFYFTQYFEFVNKPTAIANPKNYSKESDDNQNRTLEDVNILLVEDNEMNIMVASKFLSKWKAKITVAKNGDEAYQMVLKNLFAFDLVLMDLQMPIMDGYTSSMKMREIGYKGPIIALTASALLEVENKVIKAGMNDYVTKPFNPNDLYRKLIKGLSNTTPQKTP